MPTSSLMGIFRQTVAYCSLHGKQLDKICGGGYFSPSVAHITHYPPRELPIRDEASWSVSTLFLHVL